MHGEGSCMPSANLNISTSDPRSLAIHSDRTHGTFCGRCNTDSHSDYLYVLYYLAVSTVPETHSSR
jgi:hypothetical protein